MEEVLFVPFRLGVVEMRSEDFQLLAAPGTTERQFGGGCDWRRMSGSSSCSVMG